MLFMSLIKLMFFLVGKNQGQIVNNVQSCRSLLSMYAPMVERACSGHANWRHNAWNVVTSQSLLRLEIRLRRRLLWLIKIFSVSNCSNSLPGSSISFLQTNFTILSFFFLKIAKRVKENKRLSNFRNIACQLVTEIGQTCGIGLIVSNQRLILFCIIQMTFFKNKFAEYSVYPHKWKYICIKCNICNAFKICFFLFSPPLYSLQAP